MLCVSCLINGLATNRHVSLNKTENSDLTWVLNVRSAPNTHPGYIWDLLCRVFNTPWLSVMRCAHLLPKTSEYFMMTCSMLISSIPDLSRNGIVEVGGKFCRASSFSPWNLGYNKSVSRLRLCICKKSYSLSLGPLTIHILAHCNYMLTIIRFYQKNCILS